MAKLVKLQGLNIRLPEKPNLDKPGKVNEYELFVRILAQNFLTYLARAPYGYHGERPQGLLEEFIIGRKREIKQYGGRWICYLGKAIESLLNEGIISFHEGEYFGAYVLEDLEFAEEDKRSRQEKKKK